MKSGRWLLGLAAIVAASLILLYRGIAPFPFRQEITQAAQAKSLSPYLVVAVVRVESGFRPDAVSRRGAIGLMQLLPATASWIAQQNGWRQTSAMLSDPASNLRLGTWYLNYLLRTFKGQQILALAAYNGGPNTVRTWLKKGLLSALEPNPNHIPYPETRNFVKRVRRYEWWYVTMYGLPGMHAHWAGGGLHGKGYVRRDETEAGTPSRGGQYRS